jgi:hypothetical protein
MDFPIVTPATIADHARELFKKDTGCANKTMKKLDEETCKSLIGTTYDAASEAWNLINPSETAALQGAKPKHLLWTLLFLNCCCTMPILTVEVDAGCQGDDQLKNPNISQSRKDRIQKSKVRARHEIVNSWLKKFAVLNDVFRHKSMENTGFVSRPALF